MENRSQPRLELKVTVKVYSTVSGRASGQTLDFSEAGMSALMELKVGELVGLDLDLPSESVHLWAIVRNRVAFRYGFEFVRTDPAQAQVKKAYALFAQGREKVGDNPVRGRGKTKRGA